MFVNIHQSAIKSEPTVLMTPDKVYDDVTDVLSGVNAVIVYVRREGCSVLFYLGFLKFIFKTLLYRITQCCKCLLFT